MEKIFHPISGEPLTCFTDSEMEYVRFALEELDNKTSSHTLRDGGSHG